MKVLHVTNAFPYSDIPEYGVFVKEQIDAVRAVGVQCEIMFINARAQGKRAYFSAIGDIRRKAEDADVVHCHHLYSGLIAGIARIRKPILISWLNDWHREVEINSPMLKSILCSVGVHIADKVIFKSPIPAQLSGSKFVHLPNGVDPDRFQVRARTAARQRLGLREDAIYLLFVSSKWLDRPQKRYDRFRETLDIIRAKLPGRQILELVMVNQPRDVVNDFFSAADVHLLCSDFEGSPNSVKEALCAGVPVVATDVGNVHDMLSNIPSCYVAQGTRPDELADLVIASVSQAHQPEAIRGAFLAKGLSRDAITARLVALYHEMIA